MPRFQFNINYIKGLVPGNVLRLRSGVHAWLRPMPSWLSLDYESLEKPANVTGPDHFLIISMIKFPEHSNENLHERFSYLIFTSSLGRLLWIRAPGVGSYDVIL